ncbi:MAG: single-stranded DNA-binding protein [Erysipelotrichaceae bacterium]|nr:single-stranded DNA-binding protein [Erysipelotrichaceae bacterium]
MLNCVILVGRLTRDPELRRTTSGLSVASFSLAVDDSRKNADGSKNTLFMNCSLFGQRADTLAKYVRKGSMISIQGRLQQRKYTNKAGVQVTTIDTVVENFDFIDIKSNANGAQPEGNPAPQPTAPQQPEGDSGNLDAVDVVDDDLPF